MKIKVAKATGRVLNWLVAEAEGLKVSIARGELTSEDGAGLPITVDYANNWEKAGPIIEREGT